MPVLVASLLVVAAVAAAIVFAGGVGGPDARVLSQEEAEEVATLAMSDFVDDLQSDDGGTLQRFGGTFDFSDGDFGSGRATLEMEWGRGDASRFLMAVRSGATEVRVEAFCFPDRDLLVFGEEVHESRPKSGSCMMLLSDESPAGEMSPFQFGDMEGLGVTPNGDGTVTATFHDAEGNYTLQVDAKGRATRLEVSTVDGEGAFDISYGARKALTVPEPTDRIPSSVGGFCFLSGGSCTYEAFGGDAPVSDFEVRVYARGATPEDDPSAQPVATFALDGGAQSDGGFTFSPTEDGDGTFGEGDSFRLTAPGDDYEVVVWDLWADRDVQYNPMPGLAPLGAALALLGAALVARRR